MSVWILNYMMKKVFVDSGSSVNVIFKDAFDRMELPKEVVNSSPQPVYRFNNTASVPCGSTRLLVTAGTRPTQILFYATFLTIDQPSPYNVFVGRPAIIDMGALISQKDLLIKHSIKNGVGCIRGEQLVGHQLYFATFHPINKLLLLILMCTLLLLLKSHWIKMIR